LGDRRRNTLSVFLVETGFIKDLIVFLSWRIGIGGVADFGTLIICILEPQELQLI
jgi:hypothetical protein